MPKNSLNESITGAAVSLRLGIDHLSANTSQEFYESYFWIHDAMQKMEAANVRSASDGIVDVLQEALDSMGTQLMQSVESGPVSSRDRLRREWAPKLEAQLDRIVKIRADLESKHLLAG